MKISGRTIDQIVSQPVLLPRPGSEPVLLQLTPLPLGFHQRLRDRGIVPPTVPSRIGRDSQGRPLRDAQGTAILVRDPQQPEYLLELERYHQRVAVLAVAEALRADENVTFDAVLPRSHDADEWRQYADTLFAEMERSGLTAGDLVLLCREICRLSNLLDEQLQTAQQNFSPPPLEGDN